MNIIDIVGGSIKPQQNEIANKIAVKAEIKRIEGRVDQIIQDILGYYSSESEYINNNLSYGYGVATKRILSQEDKDILLKKLEEVVKSIPEKMKENINDIFSSSTDEKEKSSDDTETKTTQETAAVPVQAQQPVATTASSIFGY
jgi:hypothetical protein